MESDKFNALDLVHLYDVVHALRTCTAPLNEHTDPLSNEDCWNELYDLLDKIKSTYKEQLFDNKEILEKLLGKKIYMYSKEYDDNGVFKRFIVQPVSVAEYIECDITILPTGETKFNDGKKGDVNNH